MVNISELHRDDILELSVFLGSYGVVFWAFVFLAVYLLTSMFYLTTPSWFQAMTPKDKTLCRTGLTSYVHSLVSGAFSFYVLATTTMLYDPSSGQLFPMGPAAGTLSLALCSLSCGYFVLDLLVMLYERTWLEVRFYLIHWHHVVCIMALALVLRFRPDVSAQMTLQLLCEINNWFLHGNKLLRKIGLPATSPLFGVMDQGFYLTFFTTRLLPHIYVAYDLMLLDTLPVRWQWACGAFCATAILIIDVMMIIDFVKSRQHMARKLKKEKQ